MSGPEPEADPRDYKRRRRFDIPGQARGLNFACFRNQPFLRSHRACSWLADAVNAAASHHDWDVWAYCFMPTHAHLLLFPRRTPTASSLLSAIKLSVTKRAIRHVREHAPSFLERMGDIAPDGSVSYRCWQRGGGYDRNLWTADAIWKMIDYIHMNPVEEGLVAMPEEWTWSSAAWYRSGLPGGVVLDLEKLPARPR